MTTLLKPPTGFGTNDPSGAFRLADGHILRKLDGGCYDFAGREHLIPHFETQGWRRYEPPKPEKKWADVFEHEAAERPMDPAAILRLAAAEEVEIKVERGKLLFRPTNFASRRLVAHLRAQRDAVIGELTRRANVKWEVI